MVQSNGAYTANEMWFKAATIIFPIFGAVILFALIALAIRILKTDNFRANTSKLGSIDVGNGIVPTQRKTTDGDAYGGAPSTTINIGESGGGDHINCQTSLVPNSRPLLMHQQHPSHGHVDTKNEQFAQKNHISTLEYHLLPQTCYDPALKPNNLDISSSQGNCFAGNAHGDGVTNTATQMNAATNNLFRILVNFNCSPLQSNNNRTASNDNTHNNHKNYEKSTINPNNYWMLPPNSNRVSAEK